MAPSCHAGTGGGVRWRENGKRMSLSGLQSQAEAVDKLAEIQARLRLGEPGVRAVAISAAAVGPKIERRVGRQ